MVNFASKLESDYGSRGFQVVGVAVDDKAPYLVTPYIQRYRPNFPVGYLTTADLIKFMDLAPNVRPVAPMIMFIDSTGTIRIQYDGKNPSVFGENYSTLRVIAQGLLNQREGKEQALPAKPAEK
jgi:hypothetical protein